MQYIHFSAEINQQSINELVKAMQSCAASDDIDMTILFNSEGGSVWAGQHAQTMFQSYPGNISIYNIGIAHSVAIPVFLAVNDRFSAPNATLAFHNITQAFNAGTRLSEREARATAENLSADTTAMIDFISIRTNLDRNSIAALMETDSPIPKTARWALENGFVQGINTPQIPAGSPMHFIG